AGIAQFGENGVEKLLRNALCLGNVRDLSQFLTPKTCKVDKGLESLLPFFCEHVPAAVPNKRILFQLSRRNRAFAPLRRAAAVPQLREFEHLSRRIEEAVRRALEPVVVAQGAAVIACPEQSAFLQDRDHLLRE